MNRMSMTTRVVAVAASTMVLMGAAAAQIPVAKAGPAPSKTAAAAAVPTAMDACLKGEKPDATQTVFVSGTNGRGSYPSGVNPDNAIFPGDVVQIEITGRLRYNAKEWTGPSGIGTPDANGIRPYAATAIFNNLPAGAVGSPFSAINLRKCTDAPTSAGVRLQYGIKDKLLSDNAGGYTITTKVWKAPGRLTIDRTEVTQGVQNRAGRVALIANKRTFIRVFLRHEYDGTPSMSGVTGTLQAPGVAGVVLPLVNPQISSYPNGSDPRRLENSLLFEVPAAALTRGSRQLVVTVTPPADRAGGWSIARQVPVEFGPTTALHVIGLRYSYHNVPQALTDQRRATEPGLNVEPGRWQARSSAAWQPMRLMAENVLPLARLTIADDAPGAAWGSRSFDCRPGQRPDDGLRYCDAYQDAIAWAKRVADSECPEGGCLIVLLQPEISDGASGYCHCVSYGQGTPRGNSVINLQGERQLSQQGKTLAHEIGHYYKVAHTWEDPHFHSEFTTIGDIIGLRYAPSIQLEPEHRLDGTLTYDLMTYQAQQWLSVYNYCKAMHEIAGPHPTCYPGWDL